MGSDIELMGINNQIYLLKVDDDEEVFIMADVQALLLKIIIDMHIIKL